MGFCKPDPAVFKVVLERAQLAPEAVMFFDDMAANVAAARSVGIHAFQVKGVEGVRARLMDEKIL